jgi:BirA family biotin operon repressor/biotin-[acetyl-CoA-carboxylase] ligase
LKIGYNLVSITIPNNKLLNNSDWIIKKLKECDSTNSRIKQLKSRGVLSDRTALVTDLQTHGKGQGQNTWYSSAGKNLLVSFFREINWPVTQNFFVTILVSQAMVQLLKKIGLESSIKWPNDIYVKDKKIAGMLIENAIMRNCINDTIIGIGLNINETSFPGELPNPISLKSLTGKSFSPDNILKQLIDELDFVFEGYYNSGGEAFFHNYNSNLFLLNKWHPYRVLGKAINGRIHGVEADGRLIFETEGGQLTHLLFGDIEYIL